MFPAGLSDWTTTWMSNSDSSSLRDDGADPYHSAPVARVVRLAKESAGHVTARQEAMAAGTRGTAHTKRV